MPDGKELLQVAQLLLKPDDDASEALVDAYLRRAISTAYYALFHQFADAAALHFVGVDQLSSAAFTIIYRGFEHRRMKEVCAALQRPTLGARYRDQLRRSVVSREMSSVASAFILLQEARHLADYQPAVLVLPYEASALVEAAEEAIKAFDRVPPDEKRDVLALMLVGARG